MTRPSLALRFEKALRIGGYTHTREDVVDALLSGRFQMFQTEEAIIITEIVVYPRKRTLHVFVAAGELEAVMALQPAVEAFARGAGCTAMTTTARKGFLRVLPGYGWRPSHVTFTRNLETLQ